MAACGAKVLHLRCVEYARRYGMPVHVRSSFSQREGTWVLTPKGETTWSRRSSPASRTTAARPRSPCVGVPDKVGEAAAALRRGRRARDQHRHDRAERLRGSDRAHRHLVHAARVPTAQARWRRCRGSRARSPTTAAVRRPHRQGLAGRRRHAQPPWRVRAASSPRWPTAGVNIEMISTSEIRISVIIAAGPGRRGGRRRARRVRPRQRPRRGRRLRRNRPMSTVPRRPQRRPPTLAVVGATGAVGTVMLEILSRRARTCGARSG